MATIDDFGGSGQALDNPPLGGPNGWAAAVRDMLRELEDGLPNLAFEVVALDPGLDPTVTQETAGGVTTVTIGVPDGATGATGATPSLSIGTVGTGTAAASLTGTSEAPVLNLTLPASGTNGVDTAAIQAGAVTPAKLATTGRFVFPTGAANGYGFVSGASHMSGTGTPESAIIAAPGSTFLQTDSTTDVKGWIRWIKATGTGSTGWIAGPEADTGWRKCVVTDTAIFANGTYNAANPNSVFYLRRVGGLVSAKFSTGTSPTFTTEGQSIVLIPTGWRPALDGSTTATLGPDMPLFDAASGALVTKTLAWASGENTQMRNFNAWASGGRYRGSVSWSTSDAWPSSLPATAYP